MVRLGITVGVIIMVMPVEVTGLGLAQESLEVSLQVTTSLLAGA